MFNIGPDSFLLLSSIVDKMHARSDLKMGFLSAFLTLQLLPFAVAHPAPGNVMGDSWPSDWPGRSNGVVSSHVKFSSNEDFGDVSSDQGCGHHGGGGGGGGGGSEWTTGSSWPQTVTTNWLDGLKFEIEIDERLTKIL